MFSEGKSGLRSHSRWLEAQVGVLQLRSLPQALSGTRG